MHRSSTSVAWGTVTKLTGDRGDSCPWVQQAKGRKHPHKIYFMTNTKTEYNMIKFDEWAKSRLSQHTCAILVVNLFRH